MREHSKTASGAVKWECACDCGGSKAVRGDHLKSGATQSCGCITKTANGLRGSKLYTIWRGIKKRCFLHTNHNYKNYGERGITMCDEWRYDFLAFYNWAISNGYDEGLTIDRIDNDGNYEPSNCRWVTAKVNGNNRRTCHYVTYNGETHTISEWADLFGVETGVFYTRLYKLNFSIERYIEKWNAFS